MAENSGLWLLVLEFLLAFGIAAFGFWWIWPDKKRERARHGQAGDPPPGEP